MTEGQPPAAHPARPPGAVAAPGAGPPANPRRGWVLFAMALGFTMTTVDATIVSVALPTIQHEIGLTSVARAWVLNAYLLVLAVSVAAAGRLSDVWGQRRVFLAGVVLFTAASAACGLAGDGTVLIGLRAVQGLGAALMMPTSQALVTTAYPPATRGRALGIYAGISSAGVAIGPILGGVLTGYASWRLIFFVNLPIGLATILLTRYARPVDQRTPSRIDLAGIATLVIGLGALVVAMMQGDDWGYASARFLVTAGLGGAALAGFVLIELRASQPLMEVRLFARRNFLADNLITFIVRFALFGMAVYGPIFIQDVLGFSPQLAGLAMMPSTVMLLLFSPRAGALYDRYGIRPLATVGLLLAIAGYGWMSLIGVPQQSYLWLIPAYVLTGIGLAALLSPTMTDLMGSAPQQAQGQAAGILGTVQQVGGAFGIAVLTAILTPLTFREASRDLAQRGVELTDAQLQSAMARYEATKQTPPGVSTSDIEAIKDGFTTALSVSYLVVVGLLVAGLLVVRRLYRHPAPASGPRRGTPARPATRR